MSNKVTYIISFGLTMILILGGLALIPQLPEQVPSHWNELGQVDGYSGKWSAILLMPAIMMGIILLMIAIPSIDPKRANIALFRPQYNIFIVCIVIFFSYLHILTLLAGFGKRIDMNHMLIPAIGLLYIVIGGIIRVAKRNYMIGIRTPWTLNSDYVWEKTHQVGGIAFIVAGIICFLGFLVPDVAFLFMIIPILAATLGITVYSYVLWRQEERNGQ